MSQQKIIITGAAGFIGSNLVDFLLANTDAEIVGIDNFDPFYPEEIKRENIQTALANSRFKLIEENICEVKPNNILANANILIHLAAKAGVRPSIQNPVAYSQTNVVGTQNILEIARELKIPQVVLASSSSVYGVNPNYPWSESDNVLKPISPYAATKLATEFLGSVYANLYDMRVVCLRFFTVYGPRQRPDLAINKFVHRIQNGETIDMYGDGSTKRDYTYVADIVDGIFAATSYDQTKYEVINLGNNSPVTLSELIETIEATVGKKANINQLSQQQGDVPVTFANIDKASKLLGYKPKVSLKQGIELYCKWINDAK